MAQDYASSNAGTGTPQIKLLLKCGREKFDLLDVQIQCPPLIHEQLKKVALETWD